jgi:hypothetical protein
MPIPDAAIKDFTYLKGYVDGIISEYMVCLNPDEKDETLKRFKYNDDPHRLRTYKFMFGVMMLTRCR